MWFLNTLYFNLIFVHVALAATLTVNRSNNTVDISVAATVADQAITDEVRDITIFKDLNDHSNVVGFHAFLESSLQRKVLEYTLNPFTNSGDNFNAVLQTLDVKLIDTNDLNQVETFHLVCKLVHPQSLNTSLFFSKEIHFFSDIVPAIQHFEEIENVPQIERINAFPRYIGSRLSLNSRATNQDKNAVLLLENLKLSNYISKNPISKLNRDEILATLKVLAKMHALGISMRRKQPMVFNSKIYPYLQTRLWTTLSMPMDFSKTITTITDELRSVFTNYSEKVLTAITLLGEQYLEPCTSYFLKDPDDHTPYTTISHRDLWIANVMIKNENTGSNSLIQVKLLDFQTYYYESFANDLIYFLLACAPLDDLGTNFRSFIKYYHSEFTKTLRHVDFSLDDYTYDKMWDEIKQTAKFQLIQILVFIKKHSGTFDSSISKLKQPASDIALSQWRCIIELFIENEFI